MINNSNNSNNTNNSNNSSNSINYKSAGVDIHAGNEAIRRIKKCVESTFTPAVLTDIGSFGAMYDLKDIIQNYQHPVLVQSIDGVGTKMMIAKMMNRFDTIGMDLVSATANDIVVLGATPLTLLDYIANDRLNPAIIEQIIIGMVKACRDNGIALVGGETAEMPGTYLQGEHDLVGIVTGVVEKEKAILGKHIQPGDSIFGFTSSGLHTNGYSLARKLLFETAGYTVESYLPELQSHVGEALLTPHMNYTSPILHLLKQEVLTNNKDIKGMAHITGGGLLENIPRILPKNCRAEIQLTSWSVPPLFSLLKTLGRLDNQECYRTFNMGIGFVLIGAPSLADHIPSLFSAFPEFNEYKVYEIGHIMAGEREVRLCE